MRKRWSLSVPMEGFALPELTEVSREAERLGYTLMRLDETMGELLERFGLEPKDLTIDLGPLGPLLPER